MNLDIRKVLQEGLFNDLNQIIEGLAEPATEAEPTTVRLSVPPIEVASVATTLFPLNLNSHSLGDIPVPPVDRNPGEERTPRLELVQKAHLLPTYTVCGVSKDLLWPKTK
jgi:hypothetical protein